MSIQKVILLTIVLLLLGAPLSITAAAQDVDPQLLLPALSNGFTYQGQLKNGDRLVTSTCDFQFTLWDVPAAGTPIGAASAVSGVTVTNGSFAALVNGGGEFGPAAFDGSPRWLEIGVQCAGESSFTLLAPRQPLTAAPYASYAGFAAQAGSVAWSGVVGAPVLPTAGTGLALSGGQFNLVGSYQLPQGCPGGAMPVWNGATWVCSIDYAALSHSHSPDGISQQGSGSGLDSDLLDGQHAAAFQQRVNGSCAVGSTIRAINPNGSVVCQTDAQTDASFHRAAPRANSLIMVDSTEAIGQYTSITIGADGLPVISYYDTTNTNLKVTHCGDAACAGGNTVRTVDSAGDVGSYSSIAIGADGLPVISYYDATSSDLKVAHCGDAACISGNTVTTVDSAEAVGQYTSIAIGADGFPVISYYDSVNTNLMVAHCEDAACAGYNTVITVDSAWDEGSVGSYSSIAIGADGLPVISYYDATHGSLTKGGLKVAHCGNADCTGYNTVMAVDRIDAVGLYTSITIGADGLPVISYYDSNSGNLKVAHCGDADCATGNTVRTVDSAGADVGSYTSITIGADGLPVVSYYDSNSGDLKVAHCGNVICNIGNTVRTVDSAGSVGLYPAITIGADGLPVISHYDATNGDLKVVACANVLCIPYFRRR